MKKTSFLLLFIFVTITLISCSNTLQELESPEDLIKPGDKIGDMTIEQSNQIPYLRIWRYCEQLDQFEPTSHTTQCELPALSHLDIYIGWFAKESRIDSNWNMMEWHASIDGEIIDLQEFDWTEIEYTQHGENHIDRNWTVTLHDLNPGEHTLISSWTASEPIDDGFNTYQPGTYKQTTKFIVQERKSYPPLTEQPESGQHAYSSEDAQLEYLLYLPTDYGIDPQKKWPLIVYLHGATLRGAPPELLVVEEPLPRKLEREDDFPFLVLSPISDGNFDCWSTREVDDSLFILLEDLNSKLDIDPSRIYLTGNDMGGNGVWEIGLQHPEYFAALAPVSGYYGYPFTVPENICDLKEIPVWAFHGRRDTEIPLDAEQQLVDALNACGGNAQITISRDMQIDVCFKVYQDQYLYEWFLVQSRE